MSTIVVYVSNGAKVGAGMRVTRVTNLPDGSQKFEFLVDEKAERFVEVTMKSLTPVPPPNNPPLAGDMRFATEVEV